MGGIVALTGECAARLQRTWRQFNLLAGVFIIAAAGLLAWAWQPGLAARWLLLPVIGVGYLSWVLRRNLHTNHRPGEAECLPSLGWGNRLTLARGVLVAALAGFLLLPAPPGWLIWLPGMLYTLAAAADFFDGYLARITNHTTRLGEVLDMSFDGLGMLAASLLVVQYGQAPLWYVLIGLARYLFLAGMWLRTRLGRPNHPLAPNLSRRIFAGLQMGFLAALLLPLFSPPGTHIAALLFGLPLLIGFGRDWLFVSGLLRPPAPAATAAKSRRAGLATSSVRLLAGGLGLWLLLSDGLGMPAQAVSATSALAWAAFAFHGLMLLAVTLGILPRICAIAALCGLGFLQIFAPLSTPQIGLAVLYSLVLYLGGGAYALYTPEEVLFQRPAGQTRTVNG